MVSNRAHAADVTMSTGGLYSLATLGAKHTIDGALPLVLTALKEMDLSRPSRPFVLSDMGCADGGTSLAMIKGVVETVRGQAPQRAIQVVYADQPGNDFNSLTRIAYGLTDFESFYGKVSDLYLAFSATSFYEQILPPGVVDLGFSATAMHWLSRKPCDITGHVHAVGASGAELEAFRKQAAVDLETILLHRARELAPGGRLVLVNFCRDEEGRYLGHTGGVSMHATFNALWRQFVEDATISDDEYTRMTLPQYYNSVEELKAPFASDDSPVAGAGLRLEHIETRIVPCPFAAAFRDHGDAERFAKEYVPTLRTWTESTFFAGLSDDRPMEERLRIIDDYYGRYEALVASSPEGHAMDYVHAYLIIARS